MVLETVGIDLLQRKSWQLVLEPLGMKNSLDRSTRISKTSFDGRCLKYLFLIVMVHMVPIELFLYLILNFDAFYELNYLDTLILITLVTKLQHMS